VNQLDVETYVKGMAEVPGSWAPEAVAAQSVVARTYALRAMAASGELCDYDLCQVYVGADNESAGQNAAVNATAGQILTYGGALAAAVYSADAGGISATPLEGFGTPDGTYPYLTSVRYGTPNPLPWHSEISLSDVAARLGYAGTLTAVSIQQAGPSGRALTVTLDGSRGATQVTGRQFASRLGLRSTLFTPTVASSATAPAAPPAVEALQVLPDDVAGMRAAASGIDAAAATANMSRVTRELSDEAASAADRAAPVAPPAPLKDIADRPATWAALAAIAFVTLLALRRSREVALVLQPLRHGHRGLPGELMIGRALERRHRHRQARSAGSHPVDLDADVDRHAAGRELGGDDEAG
jgi:SpoIID/LytB domain protein